MRAITTCQKSIALAAWYLGSGQQLNKRGGRIYLMTYALPEGSVGPTASVARYM